MGRSRPCKTSRVTDRLSDTNPRQIPLTAIAHERRNPYLVAFAVAGGLAWFMAFILWITRAQVVDYTIYNHDDAAALAWWINTLVFTGIATMVGSAVVAAVRHELRSTARD